MGLQSAMTTALTGLQASETVIDVVGNNIANSNTVGFKSSEVLFATQFLRTQSIGSRPSATSGGTNPRQVGLGVKVAQISPIFSQGTIEISANSLDLAIQGDGFLMVQGGQGETLYTRNGQLGLNSNNEVVTPTGKKLLGYTVNDRFQVQETGRPVPITIPLGAERVAQETNIAVFAGVLNPTVEIATTPAIVSSEVLGTSAVEFPDDASFDINSATIVPAPIGGTATAVAAGTGLGAGVYTYRVTLVDSTGQESSASTEFAVTANAGDRIDITGLNTGVGAPWDAYAIYRTEVDGSDFRQISAPITFATIDGAGGTTADSFTDAAISGNQPIDAEAIENGTYSYYVTYVNTTTGGVETRPSVKIGSYALSDDNSSIRLNLSDLLSPDDGDFDSMRIYRNISDDTTKFQLVDTVAVGTGSYIDNKLSSSLGAELNFDGPIADRGTALVDIQVRSTSTYKNIFELGTLSFTGEQNGSDLDTKELEITATTTMQNLMDFMTQSLGLQATSNVTGPENVLPSGGGVIDINNGVLSITSNFGEENAVAIPLSAFKMQPTGSTGKQAVNVRFSETQQANGPGTSTDFLVYDSLGSPLSVRITTVLESSDSNRTTYRWYASSGDSEPAAPDLSTVAGNGILNFDSKGNLEESLSGSISILRERTASESPLEIDLDFSSVTSLAETNALGEPTSSFNMTSQDGFPPGVLTDFIITESGLIQGQFSNGTQRTLGQVVMARFANNQGLQQLGDSLFGESVNSGEAQIGDPGENGLGALTSGAVELSNTDIGKDLIEMILAQTQYQAGSRVISAAQELLDELLALQR